MGKNNQQRRKLKKQNQKAKPAPSNSKPRKLTLADINIDRRFSITAIPIIQDANGIRVATDIQYSVQDASQGLVVVKTISQRLIDKFRAVSSPFTSGGIITPEKQAMGAQQSWPRWDYLSEAQKKDLAHGNLIVSSVLMMYVISHIQFGPYVYAKTDIQRFLDSYTEIAWIDYVIRYQLMKYDELHGPYGTTNYSHDFNPLVAECWLTLENCIIRIAGMWDRLVEFLLPLYFFGQTFGEIQPPLNNKNPRGDLAKRISSLPGLNAIQKTYFDLLVKAVLEYEKSTFKNLRNRVIHEFVHRPAGAVPTGSDAIPTPATIEDLHKEVLGQLSKVREAVMIFTALVVHKLPLNNEISTP